MMSKMIIIYDIIDYDVISHDAISGDAISGDAISVDAINEDAISGAAISDKFIGGGAYVVIYVNGVSGDVMMTSIDSWFRTNIKHVCLPKLYLIHPCYEQQH